MVSTDKDLGRLKILYRGLFYILFLVLVVVMAVLALIGAVLEWEFLDPGFIGEKAPEFQLTVFVLLMWALLFFLVVCVMLMNIVRSIYCEYSSFMTKNVMCLEVIGVAYIVFPTLVSPCCTCPSGTLPPWRSYPSSCPVCL